MKNDTFRREFSEPERYELDEGSFYHFELSRRQFVQVLGAGLLISAAAPHVLGQRSRRGRNAVAPADRLHIGKDGLVTVLTSKVEVGQGSRTQITQAAAEELGLPVARIRLIMADTALVPDDGGTAGSRTTPSTIPSVRQGCAAARQILLDTAAKVLQAKRETVQFKNGYVTAPKGPDPTRRFGYAELASPDHAAALEGQVPSGVEITSLARWRVLGTPVARVGGRDIVTGRHQYPSDIQRPGMFYGAVLRPPGYGASLTDIDLGPARQEDRVIAVRDGDFVGFAAPTSRAAREARDLGAANARWKPSPHPSSDTLFDYLRQHASDRGRANRRGDFENALDKAAHPLRATYQVAYIQHAPMEPRAAVAEWDGDQLTVWTGTQQPARVRAQLADAFRTSAEKIRVIVPDTGGGFGGKHSGETAVEAARLARAAGKPVSLQWTREEEFTWAYFRPAGLLDLAGGLDRDGNLVAWQHVNFNSGGSALDTPYAIPHAWTEFRSCEQPLRSGSYRALASAANAFARESFMDELAAVARVNPLEFRLRHLQNDRLRAVLQAAAERFQWNKRWSKPDGTKRTGVGLGCGTEKGSHVATCAEIDVDPDTLGFQVRNVCVAFECGAIHNPANLQSQVEGCVIQGLGAVLHEQMRFKDGKILNPRFSDYQVPRFSDVPEIDVVLLNRPDLPSVGAGETPIIGIAPAVGNAIHQATGTRLRSLPLKKPA